jgi:hypothetical protein
MNPQQQGQDVYDTTGKGTFAANGAVPLFARAISTPQQAAMNMATLRPGGAAGVQQPVANPQEEEELQDDYLESLFNGENLSEDFKFKAKTIFEAAVNEKVSILEAHILQAAKEIISEQTEAASEALIESKNELVEHVDGYLSYVVNEWMTENKVAVERGLRTEIAENFIMGLKDLFESSFIDVPQEKYDVLDDVFQSNEELHESVNSLMKENISLKNEINAHLCAEAFMQQTAGLAETQIEKLASLAEGIEFENVDQYAQKIALLKESYFNTPRQTNNQYSAGMLVEDTGSYVADNTSSDPLMESVMNTISKIQRNQPKTEKLYQDPSSARLSGLINTNRVQDKNI